MRAAVLAGAVGVALCGPALAADFGIPIDVLPGQFNIRAGVSKDPVTAADPVCLGRTACASDLGFGVTMLMGTAPDSDMVGEVKIVSSPSPAGFARFTDGCIVLVGLLSPAVPEAERRALLHDMNREALQHGTATHDVAGHARYALAVHDDARLVFTAER